jgi:FkbH-like protein
MKLLEALEAVRQPAAGNAPPFRVFLACGFTPLDLTTFLTARLRRRLGGRAVEVATGLFGDLAGNIGRLPADCEEIFIALEWADLDPRLGWRSSGGWNPASLPDTVHSVRAALERLAQPIDAISIPVTLSLPTLPLAPIFIEPPELAGNHYRELNAALANFSSQLPANVRMIHPDALAIHSPPATRLDIRSDLATGFPYSSAHADALAELFCAASLPETPKKGLITDLDDTLWSGILGEDGLAGIAWDLDGRAQMHGLYQKTIASLAASGVLVGVASKNDPELAREALGRHDLLIPAGTFYPVETHWSAKSESVGRILQAWNIAADAVVFVDDSPLELAEVESAHPGIEALRFRKDDPAAVLELLWTLRRRFGKRSISDEDRLRAGSLRDSTPPAGVAQGDFLAQAEAWVTFDPMIPAADDRALELVNKTNQFNLNGVRYSAGEWSALQRAAGVFLQVVSYRDRFGPLGRIAVLAGRRQRDEVHLDVWVMSCRAFSRRIEHKCLAHLFETFDAGAVVFDFRATERNGPLREFFSSVAGEAPTGPFRLTREQFAATCPALHHGSEILAHA